MEADKPRTTARPVSVAYNTFILILTVYSMILVLLLLFFELEPSTYQSLLGIDAMLCVAFLADFVGQLYRAPSKSVYLKRTGWLELLGSLPGLPFLRFARLVRLVGVVQELRQKSFRETLAELRKNRVGAAILFVILFGLIALTLVSLLVLVFEADTPGANITSFADAFWWSIVTTSTVGYGDYYPVTSYGRMLSIILMTVGIGIFGLLASGLASWFLAARTPEEEPADKTDIASLQAQLAGLQKQLQQLSALIENQQPTRPYD
jgi:voltage-gated potassium channel